MIQIISEIKEEKEQLKMVEERYSNAYLEKVIKALKKNNIEFERKDEYWISFHYLSLQCELSFAPIYRYDFLCLRMTSRVNQEDKAKLPLFSNILNDKFPLVKVHAIDNRIQFSFESVINHKTDIQRLFFDSLHYLVQVIIESSGIWKMMKG